MCFFFRRFDSLTNLLFGKSFFKTLIMFKSIIIAALAASASAFAPVSKPAFSTKLFFEYGKFDGQVWDMAAKMDVYNAWDPNAPRSPQNFNPFETFEGNSPDCSGFYPGEGRYKDPARGDVNFQQMMEERKVLEDIAANPKAGFAPGCPGCRN